VVFRNICFFFRRNACVRRFGFWPSRSGFSGIGFFAQTHRSDSAGLSSMIRSPSDSYQTHHSHVNLLGPRCRLQLEAYRNDGTAIRFLELFPIARTGTKKCSISKV